MPKRWMVIAALLAGCSEGSDGGGDPTGPDVSIIRGDPAEEWIDLRISGDGIDAPDGTAVIVQIGTPESATERLGLAVLALDGGAFAIDLPDVSEPGLYKRKIVLVDLDGDGACGSGEPMFANSSAPFVDTAITTAHFDTADCRDYVVDWPTE
jgi:hypothetical protein